MKFKTKEETEQIISQLKTLTATINQLIKNLTELANSLSESTTLSTHLLKIQKILSDAKEIFLEQTALYILLDKQMNDSQINVEEAENILKKIKKLENELLSKKAELDYQTAVLPSMLTIFENQIPADKKESIEILEKELEQIYK